MQVNRYMIKSYNKNKMARLGILICAIVFLIFQLGLGEACCLPNVYTSGYSKYSKVSEVVFIVTDFYLSEV